MFSDPSVVSSFSPFDVEEEDLVRSRSASMLVEAMSWSTTAIFGGCCICGALEQNLQDSEPLLLLLPHLVFD